WRAPASSWVRRRSAARQLVRLHIMGRAHTGKWPRMSRRSLKPAALIESDVGFVPEAIAVDDGIPKPCRKLIDGACEQQIIRFAFVVSVIAIEIEMHAGHGRNVFG